jgi:hypothetical protein
VYHGVHTLHTQRKIADLQIHEGRSIRNTSDMI